MTNNKLMGHVSALVGGFTHDDMKALRRFVECCEDPDAGGHDVDKCDILRLSQYGALRQVRPGHCEVTKFGEFILDGALGELQEYRKASKEPSCYNCAHYQPQTCHGESCPARDATHLAQVLTAHKPTFIPTKTVCIPVLPDYVFHTMAVRWPLTAEHLKRLCRELQLEMEKHQEAPGEQP